jgi:xanthine dehydrogenase YagR molybdenum-binding subunit
MITTYTGQPLNRVDGRAKVTGSAKYAAEYNVPNLAYGVVVSSAIAKGRILSIDASAALGLDGVLQVFTHENTPKLARRDRDYSDEVAPPGSPFRPLHDNKIVFSAQPIALVVADSFELARFAASLVRVEYERKDHTTDLRANRAHAREPKERDGMAPPPARGNSKKAFANSNVRVDVEYVVPAEHHNPMEMFATTVVRDEDGTLTVYDKTQGVKNVHAYLCNVFGLAEYQLRVISRYVGGAFGSGLRPQYQVFLAVLAARELKRSVRVSLTRQQMFSFGHRPATIQRVALGASRDGKLDALIHEAVAETSEFEDFSETVTTWSGMLYQCKNASFIHKVVPLNVFTPIDMRAPGAAWGVYALECALDELAVQLKTDPIELRLNNYAERDQIEDKPFSSKQLRECYRQAAEKFGWERRNPEPRSMRDKNSLLGWGMAGGVWEAMQESASAKAMLTSDARLTVSAATADIGTGTYTIMTQLAADLLGLPLENVSFKLGDSALPEAPVEGGSFTASTVGSAVKAVCDKLRNSLVEVARNLPNSPFKGLDSSDVLFSNGRIQPGRAPTPRGEGRPALRSAFDEGGGEGNRRLREPVAPGVSIIELMREAKLPVLEAEASAEPDSNRSKHSCYAHSAIFAEVKVDEDFGTITVPRIVSAVAAGRILNPKTARSQIMGGIVWGIGMALEEESILDHNFGRFMNHNFADYHIPVNADVHAIDVLFVEEHDSIVNPIGVKGVGELGLVGVAAAIANAVYHATGKRIRTLPITLDKILEQPRRSRTTSIPHAAADSLKVGRGVLTAPRT